jgi:Tol biopolymer transport system component/tRNA A-37 threonylcarbamoyl transferase component Bud32
VSTPDSASDSGASPAAGKDWRRLEQLFHAALERSPDVRGAFLAEACGGDSALRNDVESLLAQVDGSLLRGGVQTLARQMAGASREGRRLGPYVLGPLIGEGGMGEVYRARDVRLDREVAIKLLPAHLARDPERLARSEREARVLASLNHPNIAALFGLEEGDGLTGLVLELVSGVTLQQHLATRAPLPLEEALAIARQIADALEAAHQHGIVHRDLKPANVSITPDGLVKVLDFGLARIEGTEPVGSEVAADVTGTGRVLGTAAYMSPEQARGQTADRRTDIWAFGAVLFEMLTGQRAFEGESVADTLAAVIHGDPRLDRLPPSTPGSVRATIDRCLQKDARERARDIADVRLALDGAFGGSTPTPTARRSRASARWLAAAALAGALLAGALVWVLTAPSSDMAPAMRFRVSPPEDLRFGRFVLSPDGRSLAFTDAAEGRTGLWVHSFETGRSRHLERSGPFTASMFWSPDARSIGFVARGAIHRIAVDGSPSQQIALVEGFGGARWTPDGTILYGRQRGGLLKVPASGGTPVAVTELDAARGETGHTNPVMLPDGRRFLYIRVSRNPEQTAMFVGSLDAAPSAQPMRPVMSLRTQPYLSRSADGTVHLLFVRDGTLLAQELDVASMTLSGSAAVIAERVAVGQGTAPLVSVAGDTLAFRAPTPQPGGGVPPWFARDGRRAGHVFSSPIPPIQFPQISPDGTRLAAIAGGSLWVYPLDGRPPVRLTSGGSLSPLWSPDGQSIVYERSGGVAGLHVIAADGSSSVPRAVGPPGHFHGHGFVDGGRGVLAIFEPRQSVGSWSLVRVPWSGTEAPVRLGDIVLPTPSASAALSPDGRWLAYIADTTGSAELWVRRYPSLDAAVRISPNGAAEPVWAKDGRELFYLEDDRLMRVRVGRDTSVRFSHEPPVMLVEKSFTRLSQGPSFDVAADGRLLMLSPVPAGPPVPIEVIVNWRDRVATSASP